MIYFVIDESLIVIGSHSTTFEVLPSLGFIVIPSLVIALVKDPVAKEEKDIRTFD